MAGVVAGTFMELQCSSLGEETKCKSVCRVVKGDGDVEGG